MPPKKSFMKDLKKKPKHSPQQPTTADEYLAAGVDFEEAGGKWRSGDAAKSARFFVRAIECYQEALTKFPTSFDLAYNKARVQYELTQHPKLLKQLPGNLMELLQTALESSRYALNLKDDDADVLFNTAQILTSIADGVSSKNSIDTKGDRESCGILEEALSLFQKCLLIQEKEYQQFQAQVVAASENTQMETNVPDNVQTQHTSSNAAPQANEMREEEQWVSVMEPVTKDGLVDTLLALVETLSVLCSRSSRLERDAGKYLYTVELFATPELLQKLSMYASSTDRELDAAVGHAGLTSAISEAKYRVRVIDFRAYSAAVEEAWARLDLEKHVEGLCNRAESYTTASNTIFEGEVEETDPLIISEITQLQWTLFSLASGDLTSAAKFRDDENIGKIYLMRGDLELSRASLGRPPLNLEVAGKNRGVLLGNAEKYYRGAKVLTVGGEMVEENEEATTKEALVKGLLGDEGKELEVVRKMIGMSDVILWQAVAERLVDEDNLVKLVKHVDQ